VVVETGGDIGMAIAQKLRINDLQNINLPGLELM
jgi:hypothetical protein